MHKDREVLGKMINIGLSPATTNGILPNDSDLENQLKSQEDLKEFIISYINDSIKPLFSEADIEKLLPKVIRKRSEISGYVEKKPPIDFQNKKYNFLACPTYPFREKNLYGTLNEQFQLSDDIKKGYSIAANFIYTNQINIPTTIEPAIKIVKELRAFEGCLIRIVSSMIAAKQTKLTIEEVLALYHTECGLVVPTSKQYLDLNIPPIESNFKSPVAYGENIMFTANLQRGVFLMIDKDLENIFGHIPTGADFVIVKESQIKWIALIHWFLAIIGFDYLSNKLYEHLKSANFNWILYMKSSIKDFFVKNSKLYWEEDSLVNAENRFDILFENLIVEYIDDGTNKIWKVVPNCSIKLTSMILIEGLYFMKWLQNMGRFTYLGYHAQDKFDLNNANMDKFSQILISAYYFAKVSNYGPLKEYLKKVPFPSKLTTENYQDIWMILSSNLPDEEWRSKNLIKVFIETAGVNVWKYWPEHRANLCRYNIILDHYQQLTTK